MRKIKVSKSIIFWILLIVVACLIPLLIKSKYYQHLFTLTYIWIILTASINVVQGYGGMVSLCQISFYAIGAYMSAILYSKLNFPLWLTMPAAGILTLLIALLIGFPTLKTRGHYFAIATLAFASLMETIMANWWSLTGGTLGFSVPILSGSFLGMPLSGAKGYYYFVLLFTALTIFFVKRLFNSRTGRAIVTIRENEQLGSSVGVNIAATKRLAFNISAVMASVAGVLYIHYMNYITPTPFRGDQGMKIILAIMAGGCGTLLGPVVGAFIIIFIPEFLNFAEQWKTLLFGVLLIIVVFFVPEGFVKLLQEKLGKIQISRVWHKMFSEKSNRC